MPQCPTRVSQQAGELRAGARSSAKPLVNEDQVLRDFVEAVSPGIYMFDMAPDCVINDRLAARRCGNWLDSALAQVLIHAAGLIEQPQRRLKTMDHVAALTLVEAFVIDATNAVDESQVAGLCDERLVVNEAPDGDEAVDAAGVLVVAQNSPQA